MSTTTTAGPIPDDLRAHVLETLDLEVFMLGEQFERVRRNPETGEDDLPHEVAIDRLKYLTAYVGQVADLYAAIVRGDESREQAVRALSMYVETARDTFKDDSTGEMDEARELIAKHDQARALLRDLDEEQR